jgi:uncharacterized membrane protein HdeD (DUF308 family)
MSDATSSHTPPQGIGFAIEHLRRRWGGIVAFGVLLVVLGLAALAFTLAATVATVTLNGVFFLVAGVAEIGMGAHAKGWGRFFLWLIGGALYLFAGLVCIFNPILASAALTLALGAGLIAAACVRFYLAFQLPADNSRNFVFLAAAVTLLLGLIIVTHWPSDSIYVLGTLLGIDLVFNGVGWATFGFKLRPRH